MPFLVCLYVHNIPMGLPSARSNLARLARAAAGGVISLGAAATALGVRPSVAVVRLRPLIKHGWVERLRRGLYLIRPLAVAPDQPAVPEDPWVLAREVFTPCYIGGWTATEHWGLTEQLFQSTFVVTSAAVRSTEANIGGHRFRLFRIPRTRASDGVLTVWRGAERVGVSGLERTVIDALRNPEIVGGGRHLVQIMRAYGDDKAHDFGRLVAVARAVASGAAWKRLGFLAEQLWPDGAAVAQTARRRVTHGYVRLDPGTKHRGKLVKRWGLWINIAAAELSSQSDTA